MVICKCVFLDGKEVDITVDKDATGSDLFDSVCNYRDIMDRSPFGLVHRGGSTKYPTYNWWVRMDKPLRKQITGKCQVWVFALIIKFYPRGNISRYEDIARFYSVLQVRDDLLTGRLPCSTQTRAILASYWLQSEYGEYTSNVVDHQLSEAFSFVKNGGKSKKGKNTAENDIDFQEQMIELHRSLKNMSAITADIKFLKLASSLEMYGTHFYPAFELPAANSGMFSARVVECGARVMFGMGDSGIYVHKDKMKTPKLYPWKSIQAVAFKHNAVSLKLHPHGQTGKKQQIQVSFAFDDIVQAKIVWRAAVDLHVFYRVEKREEKPQAVSVKMKRKWSVLGKKQAKPVKNEATPLVKRPQLAAIAEASPTSIRRSRTSLHKDETHPKAIEAGEGGRNGGNSSSKFPALPLKTPKSPSIRSRRSNTTRSRSRSRSRSPSPPGNCERATTAPKVASAVPPRLRSGYATSQTSTAGEEALSEVSDNTDVLCSRNIVEKAFSYAEDDGITSINSWLELCTPRGSEKRGRPVSRSAPASQRSRSRGRSPVNDHDVDDIDDYKPMIKSKRPVTIKSGYLRDLSPPLTVHYEDEPVRRKPGRYMSADNVARKDWTIRREPRHAFDRAARRFADIYRQEYLDNVVDRCDTNRRAKSMYSLTPKRYVRERSPSSDYKRDISPSTVSAHASSGSRRSCDSYLTAQYDDECYRRTWDLPVESAFTRRVLSESRLARAEQELEDARASAAMARKREESARQRRRNVTSWACGERCDLNEATFPTTPTRCRRKQESIPDIPRFIRSVR